MTAEPQATPPCLPERFVRLETCPNFRDLGGYTGLDGRMVRWRQLFRSMTPEYISGAETEVARKLGIGLVIDLRGQMAKTSGPLAEPPARRLRVGRPRMLASTRAEMLEYANLRPEEALPIVLLRLGRAYARAASAIANEAKPSLVHCRLGKDRTGVFSAVILNSLGVSDEAVIEDYALSGLCLDACHQLLAEFEQPASGAMQSRVARESPNRAAMQEVLRILNGHYGGGAAYLRFHGLRKRDVAALRDRLLE